MYRLLHTSEKIKRYIILILKAEDEIFDVFVGDNTYECYLNTFFQLDSEHIKEITDGLHEMYDLQSEKERMYKKSLPYCTISQCKKQLDILKILIDKFDIKYSKDLDNFSIFKGNDFSTSNPKDALLYDQALYNILKLIICKLGNIPQLNEFPYIGLNTLTWVKKIKYEADILNQA